jgi:hypothetical protein
MPLLSPITPRQTFRHNLRLRDQLFILTHIPIPRRLRYFYTFALLVVFTWLRIPDMWSIRLRPLQRQLVPARTRALSSFRTHGSQRGPRNSIQRPELIKSSKKTEPSQQPDQPQSEPAAPEPQDAANPNYDPSQNTLLSPVYLPEDPHGVLKETHPATSILANSGLVVQRQIEMMNIMM